ncbi:MAG: O-antigen ligase family protein [Acidimicrobiales bacterium]
MSTTAAVARVARATHHATLPLEAKLVVVVAALDNIGTTTTLASSLSLSSVVTLVATVGLLVMWLPARMRRLNETEPRVARALARDKSRELPRPLWLWFVWVLLSFSWNHSVGKYSFQNLCVYAGFMFTADLLARHASLEFGKRLVRALMWVVLIISAVYLFSVVQYGLDNVVVLRARGTAMEEAMLAGTAVLAWRGLRVPIGRIVPIVLLLSVTLSLSRMSLAISVLAAACAFAVSGRRRTLMSKRTFLRLLAGVAAAGSIFTYLAFKWAPLHNRFFGGDRATVGGVTINTSGRLTIWRLLWDNAWSSTTHVLIGQGAASSELFLQRLSLNAASGHQVADPHNDFLRMFYDFGAVGFVLFGIGMVMLAVRAYRWANEEPDRQIATLHWASFLATCGLLGAMITDNGVTYSFCMFPYGALVGLSMGLARNRAAQLALSEVEVQVQPQVPESPDEGRLPGPRLWPSSA